MPETKILNTPTAIATNVTAPVHHLNSFSM